MASSCQRNIKFSILLFFSFSFLGVTAQQGFPKIGDTLPAFVLNDLHYYSKKKAILDDFKGRPLIIDFFSVGCKACFMTLPKLDSLKKEFEGRVRFLLIGKQSPGIEKQYDNYRKHYKLDLPVDYDDSTIWNQFGVYLVPYTIWADANGVIRQITTSYALTHDRVNDLLHQKTQLLTVSANQSDKDNDNYYNNYFNPDKPLLIGGNGGADTSFLYRSILCKWDYRTYFHRDMFISAGSRDLFVVPVNKNRVQEVGVNLNLLFEMAFGDTVNSQMPRVLRDTSINHYGQWARYPLVESSRKYLFEYDEDSGKNMFSYSLIIPDTNASAKKLQHFMQSDLKNYFGFDVSVEMRKMPCWKITARKDAGRILRTKGGKPSFADTFSSFSFKNQPVNSLLVEIWSFHQYEPVFIDETGIDFNIDLSLNAVMTDLNDIKQELQKNGLDLVLGEKEMKVIVVRDSTDF